MQFIQGHAGLDGIAEIPNTVGIRRGNADANIVERRLGSRSPQILAIAAEAKAPNLKATQCFLQSLLECAADRHRLANTLHLRCQSAVGFGKLLEGKPRNLDNDVIDGRLETSLCFLSDIIGQLMQPPADSELGGNFCDRKTGRLTGQRTGAAHAWIHLNHDHPTGLRLDGKLNVGTTRLDTNRADHRKACVSHALILPVGERQRRGNGDRVAGVYATRVKVFDGADDDGVIIGIAHDLHLIFFPAQNRLLNEHFANRREVEAALHLLVKLLAVIGHA